MAEKEKTDKAPAIAVNIKSVFDSNPHINTLHVAIDGQCFEKANLAIMHANKLGDTRIVAVTRANYEDAFKNDVNESENPPVVKTPVKEVVTPPAVETNEVKAKPGSKKQSIKI